MDAVLLWLMLSEFSRLSQVRAIDPAPVGPRTYIQGGVNVTSLGAGTPNHRVSPAFSGSGVGVLFVTGRRLTRTTSLEAEFSYSGISKPQTWSYSWREDYVTVVRDFVFMAGGRYRAEPDFPFELTASAGLVMTKHLQHSGVTQHTTPPGPASRMPDRSASQGGFAFSGGIDVPLRLTKSIDISPNLRMRWLQRADSQGDGLSSYAGVGRLGLLFGVGVRANF